MSSLPMAFSSTFKTFIITSIGLSFALGVLCSNILNKSKFYPNTIYQGQIIGNTDYKYLYLNVDTHKFRVIQFVNSLGSVFCTLIML